MRRFIFSLLALLVSGSASSTIYTVGTDQTSQTFTYDGLGPPFNTPSLTFTPTDSNFTMQKLAVGVIQINAPGDNPFPVSNFTPLSQQASTETVRGDFDDSKVCFSLPCTTFAMTLSSPNTFFNVSWSAHDIRVFAPGTYTIEACPPPIDGSDVAADGSTQCTGNSDITFTVGAGQLGGHMLFDWNNNNNIDVVVVWDVNGSYTRPDANPALPDFLPAETRTYQLASQDIAYTAGVNVFPKNGNAGVGMVDGPFKGFSANFSLFFEDFLPVVLPVVNLTGAPVTGLNVIDAGGAPVTFNSGLAAGGRTFDWSGTAAAILAETTSGGGVNDATLTIAPGALAGSTPLAVSVVAVETATGLSGGQSVIFNFGCKADTQVGVDTDGDGLDDDNGAELCVDTDGDGIVNYLDPTNNDATTITTVAGSVASTGAGILVLGDIAKTVSVGGDLAVGINVSGSDIGTADTTTDASCVGGCFDFVVTNLAGLGSAQVVLPLSAAIPANPGYRKFTGGTWVDFAEDASNKVDSAASVVGVCPAPGSASYTATGLVSGNDCVQLTIEDGGPNDDDKATVNTIVDPGGVSSKTITLVPSLQTKIEGGALGVYSLLVMFIGLSFRRKIFK